MFSPLFSNASQQVSTIIDADSPALEDNSRSVTPSASNANASSSKVSIAKTGREGREKGAVAYCEAEHVALLSYIGEVPDSFNASESSEEWKAVYSSMVKGYCIPVGISPRQSSALQSHFVDLYGGLKQGIRGLSLLLVIKKTIKV
jgi:hypothetical protein